MKKNIKKRVIYVISFIICSLIYFYISVRGEYLQIVAINEKYVDIFKTNIASKLKTFGISFTTIYLFTYITTLIIKHGLKKFFNEDKMEMPKLPNKSISFTFGIVGSIFAINTLHDKILLCFSNVWFGNGDPIFNFDIAYYMFIIPFVKALIIFVMAYFILLSVYITLYYLIIFSKYFKKGISFETLKKNTFLKQMICNIIIIVSLVAMLVLIGIINIQSDGFMNAQDGTILYGAGLVEITIKGTGYLIFSIFMIICILLAVKKLTKGEIKKAIAKILLIPTYLVVLFILVATTKSIYLSTNEFDKEKKYISYNIDIEERTIQNDGAILLDDVLSNKQVLENINLINENIVLENLKEYYTNSGYYCFNRAEVGFYNNELCFVSPREILSNDTRTYNNKTFQYTHGFDVIISKASELDNSGMLKYERNGFNQDDEFIKVEEPRIYFGLQTNEAIVTNTESELEYDYPLTNTTNIYNNYDGKAGIHLDLLDRLILGIKEKNLKLAFLGEMTEDSNIIINRNIIKRAQSILPYIEYDPNPYMIIADNRLVWVLDGYTVSDKYPYSQKSNIAVNDGFTKRINYIRNSVKVFIDAYDGTMEFYITDRSDPIIMAYWNKYQSIFEDINKEIPDKYKEHLIYPKYLYEVQAKQIERYHDMQEEVLYRADDVWNTVNVKDEKKDSPYYTMVKTEDSNNAKLGLVLPFTIKGKQNIISYLVGTDKLTVYRLTGENPTLGKAQLERLIEEDEKIAKELKTLEISGTRIEKYLSVIPINNKLLYVETIFQVLINENQVPILKKVVLASGDKLAIGDNIKEALDNLLSQEAVNIEVEEESVEYLIEEIIKANKNLEESNLSNDWTMIGKDIQILQNLINKLEKIREKEREEQITI